MPRFAIGTAPHGKLLQQGFDIKGMETGKRSGIETAVDAAACTKRDVDIKTGHSENFDAKILILLNTLKVFVP